MGLGKRLGDGGTMCAVVVIDRWCRPPLPPLVVVVSHVGALHRGLGVWPTAFAARGGGWPGHRQAVAGAGRHGGGAGLGGRRHRGLVVVGGVGVGGILPRWMVNALGESELRSVYNGAQRNAGRLSMSRHESVLARSGAPS